jgi:hypothetical protein
VSKRSMDTILIRVPSSVKRAARKQARSCGCTLTTYIANLIVDAGIAETSKEVVPDTPRRNGK